MELPHILTLDDIKFDSNTGTLELYTSDYKEIIIPDNFDGIHVTSIGDYAFWASGLTSVLISSSVISIGSYAFWVNSLTSVNIPNYVISIKDSAFSENSLISIEIPHSVIELDEYAFDDGVRIIRV